nr:FHA domain-containing protein [Lujinxingiaceae bacterium]
MASFWLEYEQNGNLQKFPFDAQSISIGRDKGSDFVLDHPTISRQHALIMNDGQGSFRLVALSRGGLTALEGTPVQSEIALYDGAVLHLGKLWFRFRSEYAPRRPAAPQGGYNMGGTPAGSHSSGGFAGGSAPAPSFGGTPGPMNFGAPPQQQGFGAPPQQQGFGAPPPQQQGFGAPPPQQH